MCTNTYLNALMKSTNVLCIYSQSLLGCVKVKVFPCSFSKKRLFFSKRSFSFQKNTQTFGLFFFKMVKRTVKRAAYQISSSTASAFPDPNLQKGRGTETSWGQKAAIMEWLELPPGDNFRLNTVAYNGPV